VRDDTAARSAESRERCTPARQALVVRITDRWGEVGSCGRPDGGRRGTCVFCGEPAGHFEERCWRYTVLPDTVDPDNWRLDPEPGPEAA
jgi:hypothetical protein